jgi:hypothetical protein
MKPFKCPLCSQPVSEALFEKITGIWRERRVAEKKFREQEKKLVAQKQAMIRQLADERQKLRLEQKVRVRQEVEGQVKKYSVRLAHLEAEKGRMKESFDRKVALAVRSAEARARTAINRELKGKMMETVRRQVAQVTAQTQKNLFRAQQTIDSTKKQMSSLMGQNMKQQQRITNLEKQLKNQTTPQLEGLLYEDNLLEALKKEFPEDKFEHPGKGGDLLHFILKDGERVGVIVYECKKVLHWNSSHLEQAAQAKLQRKADYAVLVTNAQKKGSGGIFVERGVVVVGPGGAIAMAGILRGQITRIAELKLTKAQREDAIEKTLEYLQGPEFKNALEVVIRKTKEMYDDLKKECQDHVKIWRKRYDSLRTVYLNSSQVHAKTAALIAGETESKRGAVSVHPFPALPELTKSKV